MSPRQLEALEHLQRQQSNPDVGSNVDTGIGKPHLESIQTLPTSRVSQLRPEVANGPTGKHRTEKSPARIYRYDSNHHVACLPETVLRENPQVLEQDGEFGARHAEVVDPDADVEGLLGLDTFVEGEGRDVAAHTPFH